MRLIKKQFSLWRLVLIVGGAAIAIPNATGISPPAIAVVTERQDYADHQTTAHNEDASAKHSKDSKAAVGPGVESPQDDFYERRREYWEKRVERDLDDEDEQDADDKDDADAKDNKAGKDDGDDEDEVEQEVERRREYWRKRVERDW